MRTWARRSRSSMPRWTWPRPGVSLAGAALRTNAGAARRVLALLRADAASGLLGVEASLPPSRRRRSALPARGLIGRGGMGSVYKGQPQRRPVRADGGDQVRSRPLGGRVAIEALVDAERRLRWRGSSIRASRASSTAGGAPEQGLHYLVMGTSRGPGDRRAHGAPRPRCARADHAAARRLRRGVRCAPQPSCCIATSSPPTCWSTTAARAPDRLRHPTPARRHSLPRCRTASRAVMQARAPGRRSADGGRRRLRARRDAGRAARRAAAENPVGLQPTGLLDAELAAVAQPRQRRRRQPTLRQCRALADRISAALAGQAPGASHAAALALPRRQAAAAPSLARRGRRGRWRVADRAQPSSPRSTCVPTRLGAGEQRFEQVRSLANYMLGRPQRQPGSHAGATAVRRELVERSQHYLDALAQTAGANLELQREVAVGLGRLAEIQGGWAVPTPARARPRAPPSSAPKTCSPRWWPKPASAGPGGATSRACSNAGRLLRRRRQRFARAAATRPQAEAHARQALQRGRGRRRGAARLATADPC